VVFVSEPVGFKSVSVPVSSVLVLLEAELVGVKGVEVLKEDDVVVAWVMENCVDWAYMVLRCSVS